MATTTVSVYEFHQNIAAVEEATKLGRVIIADEAGPRNVLISISEYRLLCSRDTSLAQALSMPELTGGAADFEFEKLDLVFKPADFA